MGASYAVRAPASDTTAPSEFAWTAEGGFPYVFLACS
jgi:hypothetical protein